MAVNSKSIATALLSVAVLLACGCRSKPKAPALIDEPVFQSDEGFRFRVPEGWIMSERATVPPGPVEKERLLVQYRHSSGDGDATLDVSLMDLPENTDLTSYLSRPSFSARRWDPLGRAESLDASGVSGTRFRFRAPVDGKELLKEVTAFRRGDRVYFFTLLCAAKDADAVAQVRRSIGGLEWTRG